MKPAFLHWVISLVVLFSLIPFQSGGAHASSTAEGVLASINSPLSLEGWFHILWGDPQDAAGKDEIFYLLVDDQGRTFYLDLEAAGKPFSEILLLNGERVSLQGSWSDSLRDSARNPVLVEDIRAVEDGTVQGSDQPQPLPPVLGHQPYVSILCKFSDFSVEPKNLAFFQGMYKNEFPGLDHYWRELSYNQVDLLGSNAYGWFTLLWPRSHYIYDMNSDGDPDTDFGRLVTDCTAAADASVYFPDFVGVNLMFNADLDGYSYGGGYSLSLDSVTKGYGFTWIADWGYADISVVEHEMGHSFGLPHSSGMYGLVYDNWWDVMSWDRHSGLPDATYGRTGQHTIAYHKDLLGWLEPGEKFTVPQDDDVHTVTLERLALPQTANPKMAIVPVKNSTRFYTVETREGHDAGYDRNLYGINLIIHEVDPAREIPAQVVDYDNNGATNDDGAVWVTWPGKQETFIDATDGISVTVVSVGETYHTVDIRITDPFPFPGCAAQTQMPEASCDALTALYDQAGGSGWDNNAHWLGPEWPCRWFGVSCKDEFGDVEVLYLEDNDLAGTIPAELGNLSILWTMDLGDNALTGSIPPELGNLANLYSLDLSYNQLSGNIPAEMGSLQDLELLNLSWNQLSGGLPTSLGSLQVLKHLDLSRNLLTGSLPAELGNLVELRYLNISNNQLSGSIPSELGNLVYLYGLWLNTNAFTSSLPDQLGNLVNLRDLDVSWNQLSGSIPASFSSLSSLQYAYFSHNHLTGPIPLGLVALSELHVLRMESNALDGSIPAGLGDNPAINYLSLANNKLSGEIPPNFANLTSLYYLDLGYNLLSSSNPGVISFLNIEDPDWATTQTVSPQNLQAAQQGADVRLTWTPILYTGDGGNYEISAALSPGGPFAVIGSTGSKSASEFLAADLGSGSHFFRLRTFTPQHYNQQSDLWSKYTSPLPYQAWAIFMPILVK